MRGICILFAVLIAGGTGLAANFAAQGRAEGTGWFWSKELYAQWQFFDLAWAGEHLVFALTLETRGWVTPPPPMLGAFLIFSSFGSPSRTQSVLLRRVAEQGPLVRYFGQAVLARRDVGFGSYLVVTLRVRSEAEVGVHAQALSLVSTSPTLVGAAGMGGPFVPAPSHPSSYVGLPGSSSSFGQDAEGMASLSIRECVGPEDAPYLAPGTYRAELGWAGPGSDVDSRDWFRVNLNPGQRLELRLATPRPVLLRLIDPVGQEVGRLEGQGELGLVYEAQRRGAYLVCIAIGEAWPLFPYTVEIVIRR